jgi:uncharacterized protein
VVVVSDSSIFIGLAKIGKLQLLQEIFGRVYLPAEVFRELTEKGKNKPGAMSIKEAAWIERKTVSDSTQVRLLMLSLDKGEAEVLALAKEIKAELILVDEEKARKSAVLAGFNIMGIVGVLTAAKKRGLLSNLKSCLKELQKKNFRISDAIIRKALIEVGE